MIRKIGLPFVYFIFGMLVAFIESEWSVGSYVFWNPFNLIFFSQLFSLILIFEVRFQFKKIKTMQFKYLYLILTVIILAAISYYWIQYLVWK